MELRRHYFVLPSQKVNTLKKQLFLDLQNRGGHRQTTVPETGEADRQAEGAMAYQNRDSQMEISRGISAGIGKPEMWSVSIQDSYVCKSKSKNSRKTQP